MANPRSLLPFGNSFQLVMDDATTFLLHPAGGNMWVVAGVATPVTPPPAPGLHWPFTLDVVTYEFKPPDRPNHEGMDFSGGAAVLGNPIPSAGDGVVWSTFSVGQYGGYGNGCIIDHGDVGGVGNLKTLYGHMNTYPIVSEGQAVTQGQNLGPVGNTGNSFGAHLHFEVWLNGTGQPSAKRNPREFCT